MDIALINRCDDDVCPKTTAVLANAPSLVFQPSIGNRLLELTLGFSAFDVCRRVKNREVLADDFFFFISLDLFRAGVPADDVTAGVKHENRIVLNAADHQPK